MIWLIAVIVTFWQTLYKHIQQKIMDSKRESMTSPRCWLPTPNGPAVWLSDMWTLEEMKFIHGKLRQKHVMLKQNLKGCCQVDRICYQQTVVCFLLEDAF